MKDRPSILVVDDDPNISRLEQLYLEKENFEVRVADRGDTALEQFRQNPPDLILLDVMLPGMDGYQVLKAVRKSGNIPVIMVTARDETFDKVLCLELGADDYIVKPFSPREVVARVKAILRRVEAKAESKDPNILSYNGLTIDLSSYTVTLRGERVICTPKEIEILFMLASNPGQVFTRDTLLSRVWGYDFAGETRTVDTHIKRLRAKLDSEGLGWSIKTIYGVGYKFELENA